MKNSNTEFTDEMAGLNAIILGLNAELEWEDKRGMDGIKARLTFPDFDIQNSFYEYTISAKDRQGKWQPAAGGKYDPSIAHQHHSWTAQNASHLFKFSEPVIGRSSNKKENVLVLRNFRLEDAVFTDVKIEVRYLPVKSDPEAVAALTLIQKD